MWSCFNDAFVSVVAHRDNPNMLLVRARAMHHLQKLFRDQKDPLTGEPFKIQIDVHADYRYRVHCSKNVWIRIVTERIQNIDYPNFKASVIEDRLAILYQKFWTLHLAYQEGKNWWRRQRKALQDIDDAIRKNVGAHDSQEPKQVETDANQVHVRADTAEHSLEGQYGVQE